MFKDLSRRLAVSFVTIVIVSLLILFAYHFIAQYVLALLIAALTAIAVWEYEQFAKAKGALAISSTLVVLSALEVLSFFVAAKTGLRWLPSIGFYAIFLILFARHFRQKDGAIVDMAVSTFGILYIAVPMGMVLGVLYFPPSLLNEDGRWWVAYLLIITKITDIAAYFAGNLWGRRKLAPHISPGKTVEGAIFGLVFALLASLVFHWISTSLGPEHFKLSLTRSLILGVVLGITGQFGDLSESLLKRDANKKDSNALPGLGGALDAIDSLLFNAPILYFYLQY